MVVISEKYIDEMGKRCWKILTLLLSLLSTKLHTKEAYQNFLINSMLWNDFDSGVEGGDDGGGQKAGNS